MSFSSRAITVAAAGALAALPLAAHAQNGEAPTFGLNGIGGSLGLVLPEDPIDATFGLTGFLNLGPPIASAPQLLLVPGLSFWTGSDFTEFGVLGDVLYMIPTSPESGIVFFAGGGIGLYFTSFDIVVPTDFMGGTRKESHSESDLGISLLGGVGKEMSENLGIFGTLRLKFDGIDTIGIAGGVHYKFAK